MRIIQSFWSKPFFKNGLDQDARFNGGWLNANFHFYSCLLSCLKFKQLYQTVSLYTDIAGKEILVDKLEIPYSNVDTSLEKLNKYPSELWALGKILAYSLQDSPFLHTDMDVIIWKGFCKDLLSSDIIAQNIEINFPRYKEVLDKVISDFTNVPTCLSEEYKKSGNIYALNAGILGGNDIDFFQDYTSTIFNFINNNLDNIHLVNGGIFNMIYEQVLGYNLALKKNGKIAFFTQSTNAAFTNLMKFHTVPVLSSYIHAVGYAKKSIHVCEQIKYILRYEFPAEYNYLNQKLIKYQFAEKQDIEDNNNRYNFLSQLYLWLRNASWDSMLNAKFVISPDVKFIEHNDEEFEITFKAPQTNKPEKLKLEDWDFFLYYFQNPSSVNDIVDEVKYDENFMAQTTIEEISERIFSFVMDRCIYHEILIPLT